MMTSILDFSRGPTAPFRALHLGSPISTLRTGPCALADKRMARSGRKLLALAAAIGFLLAASGVTMAGESRLLGDLSDLFRIEAPKYLDATFDSGTFLSSDYAQIQEGFQLEQSINEYFGIFGRVTAYQIFENHLDEGKVLV